MKLFNLVLIVFMVSLLSGCKLFGMAEMVVALNTMDNLDSYQMDMDIALDDDFVLSSYVYVIGNYQEMHIASEVIKMFEIDGSYFMVDEWMGLPILKEDTSLETDTESYDDFNLLTDYDFEKVDDYYVLNNAEGIYEDISVIKFLIDGKYVKEMILEGTMEGYPVVITIEYSKYNDVNMPVPIVLTEGEIEILLQYQANLGILEAFGTSDHLEVLGEGFVIDCILYDDECFFETQPGFYYNFDTETVRFEESSVHTPYLDFIATNETNVTAELFEFVNYITTLFDKVY